jgi:hypothetical protein
MLIAVAGMTHVSNCFSVGPLTQGLTLAEGSENYLCGVREMQVFYPSNTRRKNVRKTRGPIRNVTKKTHQTGKQQAIKLDLETI